MAYRRARMAPGLTGAIRRDAGPGGPLLDRGDLAHARRTARGQLGSNRRTGPAVRNLPGHRPLSERSDRCSLTEFPPDRARNDPTGLDVFRTLRRTLRVTLLPIGTQRARVLATLSLVHALVGNLRKFFAHRARGAGNLRVNPGTDRRGQHHGPRLAYPTPRTDGRHVLRTRVRATVNGAMVPLPLARVRTGPARSHLAFATAVGARATKTVFRQRVRDRKVVTRVQPHLDQLAVLLAHRADQVDGPLAANASLAPAGRVAHDSPGAVAHRFVGAPLGGIGSVPRDAPVFRNVNGAGDQPLARRDHGRGHAVDVVRANLAGGVAASLTLVGALRLPLILKRNVRRARRALAVRPLHVQDRHGALELTLQNFRRTRAATGRPVDSHALRVRQRRNFGRNGIPVGVVRVKRIPHYADRLAERRHEQVFLHCHGRGRSVHSGRGRGRCRLPNGRGGRGGRGVVPTNAPLPIHRNHTLARRARRGG